MAHAQAAAARQPLANAAPLGPIVVDGAPPRDGYEEEEIAAARPVPAAELVEFLATVDLPVVRSSEFCQKIANLLAVGWQSVLAAPLCSLVLLPLLARVEWHHRQDRLDRLGKHRLELGVLHPCLQ